MPLGEIAFRIFGKYTRKKKRYGLQENLRKARMPTSADVYAATAMFSAVLVCIPGFMLGFMIGWLFQLEFPFMLMLIVLFPAIFAALTYQLTISYPGMVAGERKRKIDGALIHTIGFMHAMSRSGATIVDIFRELSTRTDVGELQKEAQAFMRDVEYLGQDPLTALRGLARTTPSEKFKSFLEVLISIIETGGEVTPYFSTKCFELQTTLKEENKKTISSLEFMAELYVILIAFTPLLFLTLLLFMQFLQPVAPEILMIIAYGWIPLGSLAFAIMVSTTSPVRIKGVARAVRLPPPYKSVSLAAGDARDRALLQRLRGTLWQVRLKRFLSNPFRGIVQNPSYTLIFSAPAAVIFLLFSPAIKTSTLIFTFLIAAIPYAIAYEFRSKRERQINEALPNFLKSLSSASRSGLTLPRAIAVTSTADLGPLTDEVRRARMDIEWGSSASEALARMEQRVAVSDTAARTTTLIRKASEAEEDVSDVIDIVLNDVEGHRTIAKERSTAMFIYKLIIILTFGIFLITVYFIVGSFLAMPAGGVGVEAGGITAGGLDVLTVKLLFYRVLLLQGLFAGLLAAQLGEGDLKAGIKYSAVMVIIAWAIFEFVLMPMQPPVIVPEEEAFMMLPLLGV